MNFPHHTKDLKVVVWDSKLNRSFQYTYKTEIKCAILRREPLNTKSGILVIIETNFFSDENIYRYFGGVSTIFDESKNMRFENFKEIFLDSIESYVREFYIRTGDTLNVNLPHDLDKKYEQFLLK